MKAYRPEDYKSQIKMEENCNAGLKASHHLSTLDKLTTDTKVISFKTWIDHVRVEIEECGMDPVFRLQDASGAEHYILEEFGLADVTKVNAWVKGLQDGTVGANGRCEYDMANLKMSGKMIRQSLDLDMLKKVQGDVPPTATGPQVFAAVVNIHQSLSSSAVRALTRRLQSYKLSKEPGENVKNFSVKVIETAKRIQGTGPENCPKDLCVLVYECFLGSSTATFNMEVIAVYNKAAKRDPTVEDWEAHITEFKNSWRNLEIREMWEAKKNHKEKSEAQAMQAQIKTLQKTVADFTKFKGKKSADTNGGAADTRECYHCGKKGHIKPNCPDKDKPKIARIGAPQPNAGGALTPSTGFDRKKSPKDGKPHTITVAGEVHKWCGTCKRWSKGEKAHLTDEHVKGKGKTVAASGALAAADDNQGSLRLMSGYMATVGQPAKRNDLVYCAACDVYSEMKHLNHSKTLQHVETTCKESFVGFQCQCEKAAGAWLKADPKTMRSLLKGQAGQR
jgi:hypothetical protein